MNKEKLPGLVFVHPPQNSSLEGMGESFYDDPIFTSVIAEMQNVMGGRDPLDHKLASSSVRYSIAVEASLIHHLGYFPEIVTGLSIGDSGALVRAGVIERSKMAKILHLRDEILQSGYQIHGDGAVMIAIRALMKEPERSQLVYILKEDEVLQGLDLANINGANQAVLSGMIPDQAAVIARLNSHKIAARFLDNMSNPLHSRWMKPQELDFQKGLEKLGVQDSLVVDRSFPLAYISTQGRLQNPDQAQTAIATQLTNQVNFWAVCQEIDNELSGRDRLMFVTFDPKGITTKLLKDYRFRNVINIHDYESFLDAVAQLRGIYNLN